MQGEVQAAGKTHQWSDWPAKAARFFERLLEQARSKEAGTHRWKDLPRLARVLTRYVRQRAKIHHVYFALALFDLSAVGIGIYLNHHLSQSLSNSTEINAGMNRRFAEIDAFRQSVNAVVTHGHNASFGKDAEKRLSVYAREAPAAGARLVDFSPSLLDFARRFEPLLRPNSGAYEGLAHASTVEILGQIVIQRTGVTLRHYASGDKEGAIRLSNETNAFHDRFLLETDKLARLLREAESDLQKAQLDDAGSLRQLEYLLGLMMVAMVCAVTLYGHKLGKSFEKKHEELEWAHRSAKKAEADSRTLAESVTLLNVELANSILQLKEAQDEIVRKSKLAQLGQLTATVAHEIRNPLGTIKTSMHLVERKIEGRDLGLQKPIDRINNGIKRCDHIITELLDFARSSVPHTKPVAIDAWLAQTIAEEKHGLPAQVRLEFAPGLADLVAPIDADRMRRVIVNLLSNATEAMVGKGPIKVAVVTPDPRITVATRLVSGRVEIAVTDNGPGISEENLAKIREPLFTTKSFGVGLGVPAVEKILEQHGGGLEIASTPGEGATFTAWFPREAPRALAA